MHVPVVYDTYLHLSQLSISEFVHEPALTHHEVSQIVPKPTLTHPKKNEPVLVMPLSTPTIDEKGLQFEYEGSPLEVR